MELWAKHERVIPDPLVLQTRSIDQPPPILFPLVGEVSTRNQVIEDLSHRTKRDTSCTGDFPIGGVD
jgi:hypothetical protein